VIRILDKETISEKFRTLSLDVVGFAESDIRSSAVHQGALRDGSRHRPTGSGKTTTLYGAIMEIRNRKTRSSRLKIRRVSAAGHHPDPVNEKKGLTFARGLRSILRHDPDKIMVGEIRDMETAQIAIQSALTGHLVFTTVHANNVVDVWGGS
jgi:type IV pilus assembly protein PilB